MAHPYFFLAADWLTELLRLKTFLDFVADYE